MSTWSRVQSCEQIQRFRGSVRSIARSRRVHSSLVANGLSSMGNFALSLSLARVLDIGEVGAFAVAFAVYSFGMGLLRAAVCEPSLAISTTIEDVREASRRASLVGVVFAVIAIVAAGVLKMPYLGILGLATHGLALYEFSKTVNLALVNRKIPVQQEGAWLVGALVASWLVLTEAAPGVIGFAVWALTGALIGYATSFIQRLRAVPAWGLPPRETKQALAFGGDYVIGSGSSQVAFNLIGAVAGLSAIGSLRAAGTLLGPVNVLFGSARSLAIPYLRRGIAGGRGSALSASVAGFGVISLVAAPLLGVIAFLPSAIGEFVLGGSWSFAQPVLPYLALELLFSVVATVPFAGFRALLAGRATLAIRGGLAVMRVALVLSGAALDGAMGAAIALAVSSAVGAIVWWTGYLYELWRVTEGEEVG